MDPSTTLVTFLLQTDPSVKSVQLIGSWDNFSKPYTMKQDIRRGRGQWRGCYSFRNVEDESDRKQTMRNGGLRMGDTYYYYYELDGSTESYDPTMPATNACPCMPGQTVNTLHVPIERSLRHRSGSVSSVRQESFMTTDPDARYINPIPTAAEVAICASRRIASASSLLQRRSSGCAESAGSPWRRFLSRKLASRDIERPSSSLSYGRPMTPSPCLLRDSRPETPSDGRRTRDISPESLRRFLVSNDTPVAQPHAARSTPSMDISPLSLEEVDEDDDNFATSFTSDAEVFATSLSPPPSQRSGSNDTLLQTTSTRETTARRDSSVATSQSRGFNMQQLSKLDTATGASKFKGSALEASSTFNIITPISPPLLADDPSSFYDSNDEDDILSSNDGEISSHCIQRSTPTQEIFQEYSLPQQDMQGKKHDESSLQMSSLNPRSLLGDRDSTIPWGSVNFLGGPIDTGLDDFVDELSLMVDVIGSKCNQD